MGLSALSSLLSGPAAVAVLLATSPAAVDKVAENPSAEIDDIYLKVFGTNRPALAEGDYVVIIDGIAAGEHSVRPSTANDAGAVEIDVVRNLIAPLTTQETAAKLKTLDSSTRMVSLDLLRSIGLDAQFDAANLALKIHIPLAMRAERALNLRTTATSSLDIVKPSNFSAYASVRTGFTFVEDSRFLKAGLNRVASDIDLGFNILGLAAEGQIRYDDARRKKWTRGDLRFTYDDRKNLVRYELGDLSVGRRPFQNSSRIAGFAAFRNYGINPYLNIRPSPSRAFELEQPARVEVAVNGTVIRTFELQSGRYNLTDLALVPAAGNDIELRITYPSGATELRSFPAFFDLELLRPGMLDFGLNFGLPYRDDNGVRRYDDGNYNGSGYLRYGLTDTLTAGINWEGDRTFNLIGAEAVWATPIGTIGLNMSTDAANPNADHSQINIQYRLRDTNILRDRTLEGVITLSGKDHRTLSDLFGGKLIAKQFRIRAAQSIAKSSRLQLNGGYEEYREGLGNSYYFGATLSRQFRFGSLTVGAEFRKSAEKQGPIFNLGLTVPLGRAAVSSSYTSEDHAIRADYNQLTALGVNSFGYGFAGERRTGSDRQTARLNYVGNRFEASVVQTARDYFSRNGENRDMRSELNFGTSLLFADGDFAVGPPLRNSFAIFKADKRAGKHKLAVDPRTSFGATKTEYTAFSGALGPAAITTLTPYFNRSIQVDAPDAPAGSSLGGQIYMLNPNYRSGYNIVVGSARNVSIVGNMVDRDGDPLKFATARVEIAGESPAASEPIQTFTNASGRFFIDGVEAGKSYIVTVTVGGNEVNSKIAIPEDVDGIYRMNEYLFFDTDVEKE